MNLVFQGTFGTCPSDTCSNTDFDVQSKKRALKREFEHDRIASHKKNAPADLQAVFYDDST